MSLCLDAKKECGFSFLPRTIHGSSYGTISGKKTNSNKMAQQQKENMKLRSICFFKRHKSNFCLLGENFPFRFINPFFSQPPIVRFQEFLWAFHKILLMHRRSSLRDQVRYCIDFLPSKFLQSMVSFSALPFSTRGYLTSLSLPVHIHTLILARCWNHLVHVFF